MESTISNPEYVTIFMYIFNILKPLLSQKENVHLLEINMFVLGVSGVKQFVSWGVQKMFAFALPPQHPNSNGLLSSPPLMRY